MKDKTPNHPDKFLEQLDSLIGSAYMNRNLDKKNMDKVHGKLLEAKFWFEKSISNPE